MRLRSALSAAAILLPVLWSIDAHAQTLRGSPASVERIYQQALSHDLHFYQTSTGVLRAVEEGTLIELRDNENYRVHQVRYPYAIPIAYLFVERFAQQYRAACGEQLVVTSAMRPRSFRLPNSVDRSVHPTGMAIDFRRPTNPRCLSWMRETLLSLEGAGVLEVVEERRPPHFHVAVFPRPYRQYVERRLGRDEVVAALPASPAAPAVGGSAAYQVRRGDTLWGIARRHDMSVEELMAANELRDNRIVAGQRLTIPARR